MNIHALDILFFLLNPFVLKNRQVAFHEIIRL